METKRFRVFNRTRQSLLDLDVPVVDTTSEPYKKLIEGLAIQADIGLWLKPYRGIPAWPGFPPFDLVYLDQNCRVVQEVEPYPSPKAKPFNSRTASALVLPAHTIFASQISPGDQLEFRAAEETERPYDLVSGTAAIGSVTQQTESRVHPPPDKATSVPPFSEDRKDELKTANRKLKDGDAGFESPKKGSLKTRFLRWLNNEPDDRRKAFRHPLPGLIAYHWTGGAPKAYHIGNISESGFFLFTEERPFLETIVLMTLQRTDSDGNNPADSLAVKAKVVRWGGDGIGLEFVLARPPDARSGENRPENGADAKALEEFLKRLNLPGKSRI